MRSNIHQKLYAKFGRVVFDNKCVHWRWILDLEILQYINNIEDDNEPDDDKEPDEPYLVGSLTKMMNSRCPITDDCYIFPEEDLLNGFSLYANRTQVKIGDGKNQTARFYFIRSVRMY